MRPAKITSAALGHSKEGTASLAVPSVSTVAPEPPLVVVLPLPMETGPVIVLTPAKKLGRPPKVVLPPPEHNKMDVRRTIEVRGEELFDILPGSFLGRRVGSKRFGGFRQTRKELERHVEEDITYLISRGILKAVKKDAPPTWLLPEVQKYVPMKVWEPPKAAEVETGGK